MGEKQRIPCMHNSGTAVAVESLYFCTINSALEPTENKLYLTDTTAWYELVHACMQASNHVVQQIAFPITCVNHGASDYETLSFRWWQFERISRKCVCLGWYHGLPNKTEQVTQNICRHEFHIRLTVQERHILVSTGEYAVHTSKANSFVPQPLDAWSIHWGECKSQYQIPWRPHGNLTESCAGFQLDVTIAYRECNLATNHKRKKLEKTCCRIRDCREAYWEVNYQRSKFISGTW